MRENQAIHRTMLLGELFDRSINQSLSSSVGTSLALLLAIAPLTLFGGPALREPAYTLLFGLRCRKDPLDIGDL